MVVSGAMQPAKAQIVDAAATHLDGVRFRRSVSGPESDLIERFLEAYQPDLHPSCDTTVFREPWLASGAPDLVVVVWHTPTTVEWLDARLAVSARDVKLVQLLVSNGPTPTPDFKRLGGVSAEKSLNRLESAGLVRRASGSWRARSLRRSFAVRKIIALEAKIGDWQRALVQAAVNRWFASESYILIDRMPRNSRASEEARAIDVGIWVDGEPAPRQKPASVLRQPLSYTSWLFNEWCWRDARSKGGQGILPSDGRSGLAGGEVS